MIQRKHLVAASLPFVLLFGCNNNAADEDHRMNIQNTRYDPDNIQYDGGRNGMNLPPTDGHNDIAINEADNSKRLKVARQAEQDVEGLNEVRTAKVITTDKQAYAAVILNGGTENGLTDKLENKIANQVRKADPSIQKVYVSANPDFAERMRGYGDKINEGRPVEGLFEEFTNTVRRVFPDAR